MINKIKKSLFVVVSLGTLLSASELSLKGLAKTNNLSVNTIDTKELMLNFTDSYSSYNFRDLKEQPIAIAKHLEIIEKIRKDLKELTNLRSELELSFYDIKQLEESLENGKKQYDRKINSIYSKNKQIDRYSYILVSSKGEFDYKKDLNRFVIDKFAIKKYDQTTTLKKTLASVSMQSVIKTQKDFGQKTVDSVYEYVIRATGTTIKVLKVLQNPFIKTNTTKQSNTTTVQNDTFEESSLYITDLKSHSFEDLTEVLAKKYRLPKDMVAPFIDTLKTKVDLQKYKSDFKNSSDDILKVLKKLDKTHNKESLKVEAIQSDFNTKKEYKVLVSNKLEEKLSSLKKLLNYYNIPITKETIGNVTLLSPKVYSETVQYKEELDFLNRKIKSYVSSVDVTEVKQLETLIDFSDLSSTTKNKHKSVKFETIHTLPFLDKNNKMGLLVFSSISLKDEITDDDLLEFEFENSTMKFIPVKKGYSTLFVAQTELTLGVVKEFLKRKRTKKYFDQYCIDNSFLPEEAKDFKNTPEEFYEYPAVCFKIDKIDDFVSWISKKTQRDMIIPTVEDWSYVASNSGTTDYCWGNQTPEDLEDDGELPENIYLSTNENDSTILPVASFEPSLSGVYDMCGNIFELTLQDGEFMYKGNSFSSYIELSDGMAEYYSDEVNYNIGLRLFYKKDVTNE